MNIALSTIPPPAVPVAGYIQPAARGVSASPAAAPVPTAPPPGGGAAPENARAAPAGGLPGGATSAQPAPGAPPAEGAATAAAPASAAKGGAAPRSQPASAEEQRQQQNIVRQLEARDREVRQHEMAHQAAGAGLTGAVSYSYERGPDGQIYAVGGEVSIDTSAVRGDPRATLERSQAIIRAAMAPAQPSAQDYRVAASARAMAAAARAELARMENSGSEGSGAETEPAATRAAESGRQEESGGEQRVATRQVQAESSGRLQRQLVETGALARLYPPGTLFSYQV
jgi:hypothetical protein